jgi:2-dehydro-3-deoxy-D-arabinonate dehydratase
MILYHTPQGPMVEHEGKYHSLAEHRWTDLVNRDDLFQFLSFEIAQAQPLAASRRPGGFLAPIGDTQELWAAGVTYLRSRTARMEESQEAGGSDFYDKVYHADRPELFFKATPHRCVGHGQPMRLRRDSTWMVPEPELTLVITKSGKIIGYTAGNDLSCRDIEGENPLYLPQAKTFDRCAAIGPGIVVSDTLPPPGTAIKVVITRAGEPVFSGATELSQMKKQLPSLVEYLYRDNSFPHGCLLMTGTGTVPPSDFTLKTGDAVSITIDGVGTLSNVME